MKYLYMIFYTIFCMMICGCAGKTENTAVILRNFSESDSAEALKIASDFANGFAASLAEGDFARWQKHMPPNIAEKIDAAQFDAIRDELKSFFGEFEKITRSGYLINRDLRHYLWIMTFVKNDDGKCITSEVIFFVGVFCEEGKPPAVSGFGVKRF